jgi:hypothetical protein
MSTSAGASGRKNVRIGERKKKNGGYAPDRERRRTWAVGDVCRRLADLGQAERLVDVDLEPQVGVVPVLDQHAQALAAGLQHALETRAAVQRRRRRRRLLLHVRQARRQARQLVRALRLVRREVAAHASGSHGHRRHEEDEHPTARIHGGPWMEELSGAAWL